MTDAVAADTSSGKLQRLLLALVPPMMLVYPVLRMVGTDKADLGLNLVSGMLAYLVAIYLFWGIAVLAFRGQNLVLLLGGIGGAIAGLVVGGQSEFWYVLAGWGAVFVPSVITGRMLARGSGTFDAFAVGLIVLTVLTVASWLPMWQEVYKAGGIATDELVARFEGSLKSGGYTEEQAAQVRDMMKTLVALVVRLTPASTVVGVILQFALGFLFLTGYVNRRIPTYGHIRPFVLWKVPFAVMPALGATILARLVGTDTMKLVADNGLVVLALFYAVGGLALTEYVMHRFGISLLLRILFYLLLFLMQVAGLLMMVFLGVIDSFRDWRKTTSRISLES